MKIVRRRKASGGTRTIFACSKKERAEYREILAQIAIPFQALKSAHGFMAERNIVTNALPHVGKAVTISLDLSDFFDSVKPSMLAGKIPAAAFKKCFLNSDGTPGQSEGCRTRQGLPTSPALANIAAAPLDEAIVKRLKKVGIDAAYTRYADDISISMSAYDPEIAQRVISEVSQIVSRCGFKVNTKKTRIQKASAGRREVCGLMVDEKGVHISRATSRKLRAARHNYKCAVKSGAVGDELQHLENTFLGLLEFSALKLPASQEQKRKKEEKQRIAEANQIADHFDLASPIRVEKKIAEQKIGADMFITNDPAVMFGMSAYTTGWTSCMSITRSNCTYKKGVAFWQRLSGVSLAYLKGSGTVSIAGVTKEKMRARCLVYALRDGRYAYGDIYSGEGHSINRVHPLSQALENMGYIPADLARGALVEGYVKQPCPLPFFDNAKLESIGLKDSGERAYRIKLK